MRPTTTARPLLDIVRQRWPIGSRVTNAHSGLVGVVTPDTPQNIPGKPADEPTAWCTAGSLTAVCVLWQNDRGDTWLAWVRSDYLRPLRARPQRATDASKPRRTRPRPRPIRRVR